MKIARERKEWTQNEQNDGVCIVCGNLECLCYQDLCLDCHCFLNECDCSTIDKENE